MRIAEMGEQLLTKVELRIELLECWCGGKSESFYTSVKESTIETIIQ